MPINRGLAAKRSHGIATLRPAILAATRMLSMNLASVFAAPLAMPNSHDDAEVEDGANLWALAIASIVLVLTGGAFAGLTIALMGQDGIYLQVLARDESEPENKNAKRVHDLLSKGKHWVLVTLLLSNVIVNETLPVVLDRCLGGGVAAVVGSTFLIVIFGEIIPQSLCVRYGLQIGGYMAKPVLALMWLMAPVAWPTAKLLDWLLGEDHGTVYKKSGLKTLVTLHKSLGDMSNRLNQDEVTIISAVLDLKEKPVEQVMTPMEYVFTISEDCVLDEKMMDMILSVGFSRIPVHEASNPSNFIGMLLVKILITYDPEDCKVVRNFPLATLPETRPETSCLDLVNFFQEGKSHMVLVSEYPGEDKGALGVVTLEDVIEELIGEEIIDESDVYIDVHKAIRRLAPAPKARVRPADEVAVADEHPTTSAIDERTHATSIGSAPVNMVLPQGSLQLGGIPTRRRTSASGIDRFQSAVRDEIRQHFKNLGPSNRASNPLDTKSTTVKVKPGIMNNHPNMSRSGSVPNDAAYEADETTSLLRSKVTVEDEAQPALVVAYGTSADQSARTNGDSNRPIPGSSSHQIAPASSLVPQASNATIGGTAGGPSPLSASVDSLPSDASSSNSTSKRCNVRSGSITENIIESRGVRKVILETNSTPESSATRAKGASPPSPRSPGPAKLSVLLTSSGQTSDQTHQRGDVTLKTVGQTIARHVTEGLREALDKVKTDTDPITTRLAAEEESAGTGLPNLTHGGGGSANV